LNNDYFYNRWHIFILSGVDKCVDNYVENALSYPQNHRKKARWRDINRFINHKKERFPLFFAEKRYKLINFAPEKRIVDKIADLLRIRRKESTVYGLQFTVYS
jgi:hypothetical protein